MAVGQEVRNPTAQTPAYPICFVALVVLILADCENQRRIALAAQSDIVAIIGQILALDVLGTFILDPLRDGKAEWIIQHFCALMSAMYDRHLSRSVPLELVRPRTAGNF